MLQPQSANAVPLRSASWPSNQPAIAVGAAAENSQQSQHQHVSAPLATNNNAASELYVEQFTHTHTHVYIYKHKRTHASCVCVCLCASVFRRLLATRRRCCVMRSWYIICMFIIVRKTSAWTRVFAFGAHARTAECLTDTYRWVVNMYL